MDTLRQKCIRSSRYERREFHCISYHRIKDSSIARDILVHIASASYEDPGEPVQMRRLASAFVYRMYTDVDEDSGENLDL